MVTEAYLQPSQISTMELFWEDSKRLKAVICFHKKACRECPSELIPAKEHVF